MEDMKKKLQEMNDEKEKWRRDAKYLKGNIQTTMDKYMEKANAELQQTKQRLKEEVKEDIRSLQAQMQTFQELDITLRDNRLQNTKKKRMKEGCKWKCGK